MCCSDKSLIYYPGDGRNTWNHSLPQFTLILQLQGKIDQTVTWPDHICTCQVVQTTHYSLIMSNQDKTGCHGNHKPASFSTGIIWVHNTKYWSYDNEYRSYDNEYRSYNTQYRSYDTQYRSYDNETRHSCHGHLASYSSRWGTFALMTTSLGWLERTPGFVLQAPYQHC